MTSSRYSFRPVKGSRLYGHVAVLDRESGQAYGHLNRTKTGYALRDLSGSLLGLVHNVSREVAATALKDQAPKQCPFYIPASDAPDRNAVDRPNRYCTLPAGHEGRCQLGEPR